MNPYRNALTLLALALFAGILYQMYRARGRTDRPHPQQPCSENW